MKKELNRSLGLVVPIIALVAGVIGVMTPKIGLLGTKAAVGPLPSQPVLFTKTFDSAAELSNLIITQNPTINNVVRIDTTLKRKGVGSILLDYNNYTGEQVAMVVAPISTTPITNVVVRTYFYDDMATNPSPTKGVIFGVTNTGTSNTGIGVMTNIDQSNYVFRINSPDPAHTMNSGVPRTKGWHMFELIVTDKGTYGKIDNKFLYTKDKTLFVNRDQTTITKTHYVSSWGLKGKSWFDDLVAAKLDSLPMADTIYRTLERFYKTYKDTDFSPLYAELGTGNNGIINSNDLRSLLLTSQAFYTYGQKVGGTEGQTAKAIAKARFMDSLSNGHWELAEGNGNRHWVRGVILGELVKAAKILWTDLDQATRNTATAKVNTLSQFYILNNSNFESTSQLSAWTNLSTGGNNYSIKPGIGRNKSSGLSLNYTNGTLSSAGHNLVHMKLTTPIYTTSPSRKATIWFYDDMNQQKAALFGISSTSTTNNIGVGVITIKSKTHYVFRNNSYDGTVATPIPRTSGWHKFDLVLIGNGGNIEKFGTSAYIDDKKVGSNPAQNFGELVTLTSSWGLTGTSVFDDLLITRMPDTGKTSDTKAEENGWHAYGLAEAVNYFPTIANKDILEKLADCYAYHTITTSTSAEYCNAKTVTAYDDFRIDNHVTFNPVYQSGAMIEVIRAGQSYSENGKAVPTAYTHNLSGAFGRFISTIDTTGYTFTPAVEGLDWTGATNTPYQAGLPVLVYGNAKGWTVPFNVSDFVKKRDILFYDQVNQPADPPQSIPTIYEIARTGPGYEWFLDSVIAGDYLVTGLGFAK